MILSIDQGTTGNTVLIFNPQGEVVARAYQEFPQYYPQAGWVEHDAMEIWQTCLDTIQQALESAGIKANALSAIGITNQRETTVLWDKQAGEPVHRAIVWQCRRSSEICQRLAKTDNVKLIEEKTGLVVDAYFSASKLQWIFEQQPELLERAKKGELAFGTIDSWLIWKLTGGKEHVTDHTNASRTMLYNLKTQSWDQELLDIFSIPEEILPQIRSSASHFGTSSSNVLFGAEVAITGVAGDQQAALFGQGCIAKGQIKNTYGTGCFMLMYAGQEIPRSKNGLLTTVACDQNGEPAYALEGAVFTAGAGVQWLRDELQLIESAKETQEIAESIEDCKGVYLVPAFTGLGAPYWNMQARGTLVGLTRGAGRKQIIRATLEAIAYQVYELANLMSQESASPIELLKVDGGACANDFLMQFQADLLDCSVIRPQQIESTAIGAALLAGIGSGLWQADKLPKALNQVDRVFEPQMSNEQKKGLIQGWQTAVKQATLAE